MTVVVRGQSRESSYFEALPEPEGVRSLLSIKTPCQDCTIFNIQYQYQYGLILILNIDKSTDPQQLALPDRAVRLPTRPLGSGMVRQALDIT